MCWVVSAVNMCVYVNSSMNISVPTPYLQCMVCQLRQQTVVVVVIQFPVEDQHVSFLLQLSVLSSVKRTLCA